jgi:catechol 2,3-dioxygenase-like lactoylglutathione lyase family enzyme
VCIRSASDELSAHDVPGYGHIAVGVDDLDGTLERLAQQGIEPERPLYTVREGGSRLCFVQDPDRQLRTLS